ncbi:hypothetical protein B7494_g420 [Chlorociboria aeruginascens]|nr:hypothetical protein B7494_g420 [Chlorociboria aeruginascens]
MPPRIPRPSIWLPVAHRVSILRNNQQACPACLISSLLRPAISSRSRNPQRSLQNQPKTQQTATASSPTKSTKPPEPRLPRKELRDALLDLQDNAGSYVNLSRLQLAIRGLEQPAGEETIRIAILGIADEGISLGKAKALLRLLLADPLKAEEEWERILISESPGGKPLLIKVGFNGVDEGSNGNRLVQEINISSPMLKGHRLEILVLEMDPLGKDSVDANGEYANSVLVPKMDIPNSNTGRFTQVTTPVHKSLIVSDGLLGAANLLSYPLGSNREIIAAALNLEIGSFDERKSLPFNVINASLGSAALLSFRESIENAMIYEKNWFSSGVPRLLKWIRSGTSPTDGYMKPPLRSLISSLLTSTGLQVQTAESRQLSALLSSRVSSTALNSLQFELSKWAERAHTELRDQLDIAFNGRRWRKLGWWKLFWRVDDVSMLTTDILNQRFLTVAENEIIFITGRIAEAGAYQNLENESQEDWAYKTIDQVPIQRQLGSLPPPIRLSELKGIPSDDAPKEIKERPWPLHIPAARDYLATETVPALQALAQKLVLQTLTTSTFTSAFAGLVYISTLSTSFYEAGAIGALGIVWSLRRMQNKWESAREFWEGEVREEGRKAVKGIEGAVAKMLKDGNKPVELNPDFKRVRDLLKKAQWALDATQ